jgi:voltage-gated potassium channel
MDTEKTVGPAKLTRFEWLIIWLSVYVVVELYISLVVVFPPWLKDAAEWVDLGICVIFLGDFFYRFHKAGWKPKFMVTNWIDFVSSIPMVGVLRIGRAARLFRLLRLVRSGRVFYGMLGRNQAANTFQTVVLMNALMIGLATIAMFRLEHGHNPFFEDLWNSLYWSALTCTTLGFLQDIAPVTPEGKVLSVLLVGGGITLFGTFTAMVSDYFIGDEEIIQRLDEISERLERIEAKLDEKTARSSPPGSSGPTGQ